MRRKTLLSHNEEGVVLMLCLITLVVLTLIGVSTTTTSRLEVEIAGNDKTYKEAFYAAEMALTAGETVVNSLLSRIELNDGITPGLYIKGTQPAWKQLVWDNTHSAAVSSVPSGLSQVSASPRYTVEEKNFTTTSKLLDDPPTGVYLFTVRAHGTGANKAAEVLLESIYAKHYN
jgi:type IV pilus assembly protein PilX